MPLRSRHIPNGHVTIVGGIHIGKAQIVTDSLGVRDYAIDERTALLVPPADAVAMASAIERLLDEPDLRETLGASARTFAQTHCSEAVTADFAKRQLQALTSTT